MKNDFQKKQSQEDILNEAQGKMMKNLYGSSAKQRILFNKLGWFKPFINKGFYFFVIILFFYIIFQVVTAPPSYSEEETKIAETNLEAALVNTGEFRGIIEDSLEFLSAYPQYYKKVVNNLSGLEVVSGVCPYACIRCTSSTYVVGFTNILAAYVLPEANNGEKRLIIDPKGGKAFKDKVEFASMLVHETDHIEYLESNRLRRAALKIKCSPLLNPHISINSRLGDIIHRVQTIEICAEKEQIRFHKLSDTKSDYEFKNGIYYGFPSYMMRAMKNAINIFSEIIKTIFSIF